jgi:hypothetical protein
MLDFRGWVEDVGRVHMIVNAARKSAFATIGVLVLPGNAGEMAAGGLPIRRRLPTCPTKSGRSAKR